MKDSFWMALHAALLAFCISRAAGVPVWNDGFRLSAVGDAVDIATVTFFLVNLTCAYIRKPTK